MRLIRRIRHKIPGVTISTDIIVGFCGETDNEFDNTIRLCKKVGFDWAYISIYSKRPMTAATKLMTDDVPYSVKKERWELLDALVNKPKLLKTTTTYQFADR